jgi:hypothetical protein
VLTVRMTDGTTRTLPILVTAAPSHRR